jgi:imidazolonepropionase-like amidohydrolase
MYTFIKVGQLIDGTGSEPVVGAILVIDGDKISEILRAKNSEIPESARVIDLSDKTLLPGFTDSHMHFLEGDGLDMISWLLTPLPLVAIRATVDARRLLEAGFTAVRCMGSVVDIALRDAVNEGSVPGPRILASGRIITQTRGHGDIHNVPAEWLDERWAGLVADGPDACRKAARTVLRDGADVIKICTTGGGMSEKDDLTEPQFTIDEIAAITEEAHRVNRKVGSHACSPVGIQNAIRGGVDTIEHGFSLDEETCLMMVEANTPLVTSLTVGQLMIDQGEAQGAPEHVLRKNREGMQPRYESVKLAYNMGIKIALGSDLWGGKLMHHGLNAYEFNCLVEAGLSPMDAIVAGTKNGAEVMGLEEKIGTLEVGKLADLVAVDGNPLENIQLLNDVKFVMKGGEIIVGV